MAFWTISPPIMRRIVNMSLGFDHCPRNQADVPSKPLAAILRSRYQVVKADGALFSAKEPHRNLQLDGR